MEDPSCVIDPVFRDWSVFLVDTSGATHHQELEDSELRDWESTSSSSSQGDVSAMEQGAEDPTQPISGTAIDDAPPSAANRAPAACLYPVCISVSAAIQLSPPSITPFTGLISQQTVWIFISEDVPLSEQAEVRISQRGVLIWQTTVSVISSTVEQRGVTLRVDIPLQNLGVGLLTIEVATAQPQGLPPDYALEAVAVELALLVMPMIPAEEGLTLFHNMVTAIPGGGPVAAGMEGPGVEGAGPSEPPGPPSPWLPRMDVRDPRVMEAYRTSFLPFAHDVGTILNQDFQDPLQQRPFDIPYRRNMFLELMGFVMAQRPAMRSFLVTMVVGMSMTGIRITSEGFDLTPRQLLEVFGLLEAASRLMVQEMDQGEVERQVEETLQGLLPLRQRQPREERPLPFPGAPPSPGAVAPPEEAAPALHLVVLTLMTFIWLTYLIQWLLSEDLVMALAEASVLVMLAVICTMGEPNAPVRPGTERPPSPPSSAVPGPSRVVRAPRRRREVSLSTTLFGFGNVELESSYRQFRRARPLQDWFAAGLTLAGLVGCCYVQAVQDRRLRGPGLVVCGVIGLARLFPYLLLVVDRELFLRYKGWWILVSKVLEVILLVLIQQGILTNPAPLRDPTLRQTLVLGPAMVVFLLCQQVELWISVVVLLMWMPFFTRLSEDFLPALLTVARGCLSLAVRILLWLSLVVLYDMVSRRTFLEEKNDSDSESPNNSAGPAVG